MAECGVFGTYSFRNVAFNIDGSLVTNFDEGDDCITIEPTSDLGTPKVGADGGSILSITADQSATVTIRLLPNSPMNPPNSPTVGSNTAPPSRSASPTFRARRRAAARRPSSCVSRPPPAV